MATILEQVIELAHKLNPGEKAKLLEQIAGELSQEINSPENLENGNEHWGKKVLALLDTLDTSDWQGIDDPTAWLKEQRKDSERHLDWGDEA